MTQESRRYETHGSRPSKKHARSQTVIWPFSRGKEEVVACNDGHITVNCMLALNARILRMPSIEWWQLIVSEACITAYLQLWIAAMLYRSILLVSSFMTSATSSSVENTDLVLLSPSLRDFARVARALGATPGLQRVIELDAKEDFSRNWEAYPSSADWDVNHVAVRHVLRVTHDDLSAMWLCLHLLFTPSPTRRPHQASCRMDQGYCPA